MLVLSRKSSESIRIVSEIEIKVISIGKGRVKLGISAPGHMRILRDARVADHVVSHLTS